MKKKDLPFYVVDVANHFISYSREKRPSYFVGVPGEQYQSWRDWCNRSTTCASRSHVCRKNGEIKGRKTRRARGRDMDAYNFFLYASISLPRALNRRRKTFGELTLQQTAVFTPNGPSAGGREWTITITGKKKKKVRILLRKWQLLLHRAAHKKEGQRRGTISFPLFSLRKSTRKTSRKGTTFGCWLSPSLMLPFCFGFVCTIHTLQPETQEEME